MPTYITEPANIAKRNDFNSPEGISAALSEMESVPEHELHQTIFYARSTMPELMRAAGLSQAELARREAIAMQKLTDRSTRWSGGIAAASALLGAGVGAVLTWWLGS